MGRDYHKEVYSWEGQWQHWNRKMFDTIHGARTWVRIACRYYRVRPPVVTALPMNAGLSYYWVMDHHIYLRPDHWNTASVLHEAAHAILYVLADELVEHDHGKEWLGVYAWLLVKAGLWPTIALKASAEACKLPWAPLSPTALRALIKQRESAQ